MVALVEVAELAGELSPEHRRSYLKCRIRGAMLDSVKRAAYRDATHAEIADWDAVEPTPDAEAQAIAAERAGALVQAKRCLTVRQREVLEYRQRGVLQREIGALIGCSRPAVQQIERRALQRLSAEIVKASIRRSPAFRGPLRPPLAA